MKFYNPFYIYLFSINNNNELIRSLSLFYLHTHVCLPTNNNIFSVTLHNFVHLILSLRKIFFSLNCYLHLFLIFIVGKIDLFYF